ncbi:MAG: 4Fe-4S dicluster domain-containing protein [Nitrospinaceae bacterium]
MDKNKSLRYLLDKERFKGKKLPPKIQTNEDTNSPDQRGDHTSADKHIVEIERLKENFKKPIEEMEFSRRGIFGGLTKLKEYAEESDEKAQELKKLKKKQRRIKVNLKPEEEETEEGVETTAELEPATETETEESDVEIVEETEEKPKGNIFRRSYEFFFPKYHEEEKPSPKSVTAKAESGEAIEAVDADPDELSEEESDNDKELNRRNLIRQGVHMFAKPTMEKIQGKIDKVNQTVDKFTKRVPLLRPPGAISERAFLQACTRCDKCIHACPKDAILRVPKKMGFIIMDTPYIDPMKVPCVMCDDLPCISACPDGALLPVPGGPADVEMGYAILDKKKCQSYGHTFCQQCVIDCPVPGAITQNQEQQPIFHRDICTGCGVCVRSCSTVNIPVAIKIKPQMVIEWQLRKKAMEEKEKELEAERKAQELAAQQQAVATETADDSPEDTEAETDTPSNSE